jgi:hypothetical protein
LTFNGLHDVISQKIVLFTNIVVLQGMVKLLEQNYVYMIMHSSCSSADSLGISGYGLNEQGSIPGRRRDGYFSHLFQIDSGAHTASCPTGGKV